MKNSLVKNLLKVLLVINILMLLVVPVVNAQQGAQPSNGSGAGGTAPAISEGAGGTAPPVRSTLSNPLRNVTSLGGLVNKFVEIFSYIVIIFAVLVLIWTGLQYILARGNTTKMKELTGRLGWIVVGIAIVIGARVIITIIINTLQASGTVNEEVIRSVNRAVDGR